MRPRRLCTSVCGQTHSVACRSQVTTAGTHAAFSVQLGSAAPFEGSKPPITLNHLSRSGNVTRLSTPKQTVAHLMKSVGND
jgi:hypothetical protein